MTKTPRKCVAKALRGDMTAMKLCLDRICPARRERPISFQLPPIASAADATRAMATVVAALADGTLVAGEAASVAALIASFSKALEVQELETRLAALERRATQ